MNPFGAPQSREGKLTSKVIALLDGLSEAVHLLDAMGKEFSANDVMAEVSARETAAGAGNVAVYGGYDTDDIRRWNALFTSFMGWKATNITTTLAGGATETKTAETMVIRFYAPVE